MSIARDHLSSGSTSSVVSLSGDYKDASGKVIRRYIYVVERGVGIGLIEVVISWPAQRERVSVCV